MAKVGEGEKRWIVENRTDGKNVNSWHWTELDMLPKGKENLKTIFKGAAIESTSSDCANFTTTTVDSVAGDMIFFNRKGKPIFVFDFNMKVNFKCDYKDKAVKGHIHFKEICDPDWPEISYAVLLDNETSETAPLKDIIKKAVMPAIKVKLTEFITEMRAFQGGDPSPDAGRSSGASPALTSSTGAASGSPKQVSPSAAKNSDSGSRRELKFTLIFQTPTQLLFDTLTDSQRVSAFTQGPAEMSSTIGSAFKLFGGAVTGTVLEFENAKLLKQKWRFQSWPANHYSTVSYEFHPNGDECRLILSQTDIPENDFERTKEGWERFFWSRIKAMFGWHYKFVN